MQHLTDERPERRLNATSDVIDSWIAKGLQRRDGELPLPSVPNETLAAAFSWPEPPSAWAERTYVPFGLHGVRSWIHRWGGRRRRTTAQQARLRRDCAAIDSFALNLSLDGERGGDAVRRFPSVRSWFE